jgi:phospholipid/cholesterol/gamma-HCH transport system permease protein
MPATMGRVERLGDGAARHVALWTGVAGLLGSVGLAAVRPRSWPRTTRTVLGRQILFTGVDAVGVVGLIALLAGIAVVTQAQLWLGQLGQSEVVGPLLVAVIVRELGPILVNFVVIARSGTAIAAELAGMQVRGETGALNAMGVDPFAYLVLPRVAGMALSVLALTVSFVTIAIAGGYFFAAAIGMLHASPAKFLANVFAAVTPRDVVAFLVKGLLPGAVTGAICCVEGLGVRGSVNEVPQAATRAVVRSLGGVLIVSVLTSVLSYV